MASAKFYINNCFSRERNNVPLSNSSDHLQVHVNLGARSYDIEIVSDRLNTCAEAIESWTASRQFSGRTALIVTDAHVRAPHGDLVESSLRDAGWQTQMTVVAPGEQTKALSVVSGIYDDLVAMRADRQTVVVAVGGGVVGDLAGFVAATYTRGVPFVQIPTTLLAQVDSSVGGKVGVNHEQGKNLIGAFHQPLGVFIDTSLLSTLPARDYRSGLAEVIKYGVILDEEFFAYLEKNIDGLNERSADVLRHVIARSCELKALVVEQDEEERTGRRAVLNYGHTFAHAYEALCGYGELTHGEAVAIGMVDAARLAERRGMVGSSLVNRQLALTEAVGLPTALPTGTKFSADDVLGRMKLDKKTVAGQLRFVLPTRLGHVEVFNDVEEADVRAIIGG